MDGEESEHNLSTPVLDAARLLNQRHGGERSSLAPLAESPRLFGESTSHLPMA